MPDSGLFEFFTGTAMPSIKREFIDGDVGQRRSLGFSLGAFKASLLAFRKPELFTSAALVSPALPTRKGGFGSDQLSFNSETGLALIRIEHYADDDAWNADSPYVLRERQLTSPPPEVLIMAGARDRFFPNVKDFATKLTRQPG